MTDEADGGGARDLRCSDADRERVADTLREAAAEGRLTLSELDERLDATFRARTYGDLEPITSDLPPGRDVVRGGPPAHPGGVVRRTPDAYGPAIRTERITAVFGDEKRSGRWQVPRRLEVTSVLGEVTIDFTEAIVRDREIVVQVAVVLGSVTLVVPEGIDVRMDAAYLLGDRKVRLTGPVTPGGPVYWVRGFVVLGEITVRPPRQRRSIFGRR
ncbi:MAG TPA: DUF1707 domain-containing protein [Jiangellaceae bacterium]|nr:DUF1707 domain-containing protein [Jiangellaceae bacterium]